MTCSDSSLEINREDSEKGHVVETKMDGWRGNGGRSI